ncbi:MAG: hypothetical protein OXM56_04455 [Gammaproteobacteria bacterium]|nr:hypothetical protein [Gammaproteobacteria bacterium]
MARNFKTRRVKTRKSKKGIDYLLKCPICQRNVRISGVAQHLKAAHPSVTLAQFAERVRDGIATGDIKARRIRSIELRSGDVISGTQRLRAVSKAVTGVRSVVSGGRIP